MSALSWPLLVENISALSWTVEGRIDNPIRYLFKKGKPPTWQKRQHSVRQVAIETYRILCWFALHCNNDMIFRGIARLLEKSDNCMRIWEFSVYHWFSVLDGDISCISRNSEVLVDSLRYLLSSMTRISVSQITRAQPQKSTHIHIRQTKHSNEMVRAHRRSVRRSDPSSKTELEASMQRHMERSRQHLACWEMRCCELAAWRFILPVKV